MTPPPRSRATTTLTAAQRKALGMLEIKPRGTYRKMTRTELSGSVADSLVRKGLATEEYGLMGLRTVTITDAGKSALNFASTFVTPEAPTAAPVTEIVDPDHWQCSKCLAIIDQRIGTDAHAKTCTASQDAADIATAREGQGDGLIAIGDTILNTLDGGEYTVRGITAGGRLMLGNGSVGIDPMYAKLVRRAFEAQPPTADAIAPTPGSGVDADPAWLEDIEARQADRLNDGWGHPMTDDKHEAYTDIETLLNEFARKKSDPAWLTVEPRPDGGYYVWVKGVAEGIEGAVIMVNERGISWADRLNMTSDFASRFATALARACVLARSLVSGEATS